MRARAFRRLKRHSRRPGSRSRDPVASPAAAAVRELAEETGYKGDIVRLIGSFYANSATQSNRVTAFLILNARKVSQQQLDPNEEIEVVLQDMAEFLRSVLSGNIELQGMHNGALLLAMPYLLSRLCDVEKLDIKGPIGSILSIPPDKLS